VDLAQLDVAWLRRLQAVLELIEYMVLALSVLLAVGVLFIIGNTIRFAIDRRRREVAVIKLIGGTDGFVRRPFLYTGLWYGIGGGLCAVIFLVLLDWWLDAPIQAVLALYKSDHLLTWMGLQRSMLLILGAGLLGWIGAWLAVSRYLRHPL
jgi:cell division transport system permease protein